MSVADDRARDDLPGLAGGHQNGEALADRPVPSPGPAEDRPVPPSGVAEGPSAPSPWTDDSHPAASCRSAEDHFLRTRSFDDWTTFEQKHGLLIARHFGAVAPAAVVLTDFGEMHVDLPRSGDGVVRDVERLLARCERLHIEAHEFLSAQQRKRCMRTISSIARQLVGFLDRPGSGRTGLDVGAIEHQIAETERMFRRAAQWNGQMEYFRGVAWTTTLLALLVVAGMAGMYASNASTPTVDELANLILSTAFIVVFGSAVVLIVQEKFSDPDSGRATSKNLPGIKDDIERFYLRIRRLCGLMVIVGSLAAVSEAVAFFSDDETGRPLLVCLLAGLVGATVSVMWRMSSGKLMVDYEVPSVTLRFLGGFRPIIGSVSGMVLYILLTIGLINLTGLSAGTAQGTGVNLNLYFAIAFLAGFSERLAPDMLDEAARRFVRHEQDSPPRRPGRDAPDRA